MADINTINNIIPQKVDTLLEVYMQQIRGSEDNWNSSEYILKSGEIGYTTDTHILKIGDDIHLWKDLPYPNSNTLDLSQIIYRLNQLDIVKINENLANNLFFRLDNVINLKNEIKAEIGPHILILDNLNSNSITMALSANQGKVLKELIDTKADKSNMPGMINISGGSGISITKTGNNFTITNTFGGLSIIDNLLSNLTNSPLSANQGRVLKELLDNKADLSNIPVKATTSEVIEGLNDTKFITPYTLANKLNSIGTIPIGAIIMWSGLITNIPFGWALCDGQNGRPNMLGKFVRGISSKDVNPGATGGNDTIILTIANLPAHSHTISAHSHSINANLIIPAHTHSFNVSATVPAHTHSFSGSTSIPSHNHTFSASISGTATSAGSHQHQVGEGTQAPTNPGAYTSGDDYTNNIAKYSYTTSAGAHTHSISGSVSGTTSSTTIPSGSVSGTTGSASASAFQVNGNTNSNTSSNASANGNTSESSVYNSGNTGNGNLINNMPAYYEIAYIIKLVNSNNENIIPVSGISLDKISIANIIGNSTTLTATLNPSNATNQSVSFTSSNTNVVTISGSGLTRTLNFVGAGTSLIIVTTVDGSYIATCNINIATSYIPVSGITLNKSSISGMVGDSTTLTAIIDPSDASNKDIEITSLNTSIVTISGSGLTRTLNFIGTGNTSITVKTIDGNYQIYVPISVTSSNIPVISISLDKQNVINGTVGGNTTLTAILNPSNATNQSVSFQSLNTSIVTISGSGLTRTLNFIGTGTSLVTATSFDGGKIVTITIIVS